MLKWSVGRVEIRRCCVRCRLSEGSFGDINELFCHVEALSDIGATASPLPTATASLSHRLFGVTATVREVSGRARSGHGVDDTSRCHGKDKSSFTRCWKIPKIKYLINYYWKMRVPLNDVSPFSKANDFEFFPKLADNTHHWRNAYLFIHLSPNVLIQRNVDL